MDGVARTTSMPVNDLLQSGVDVPQEGLIVGRLEICRDCVKVPEAGIDSVVFGGFPAVGKAVGQHSLTRMLRKRAQYRGRLSVSPRCDGQAWQRDHGIAAPVAEPWIACDHGLASLRSYAVGSGIGSADD